jgi:hypothetical protein
VGIDPKSQASENSSAIPFVPKLIQSKSVIVNFEYILSSLFLTLERVFVFFNMRWPI